MEKNHEEFISVEEKLIENVWKFNSNREFTKIGEIIDKGYTYVTIDTEFPGIVYFQNRNNNSIDNDYQEIKLNVEKLTLIQVGFSFSNGKGQKPEGTNTWQFNLTFNLESDPHSEKSIEVLKRAGIKFDYLKEFGIKYDTFCSQLVNSKLMKNPKLNWITFHGIYDMAYLLKAVTGKKLPETSTEFFDTIQTYFPTVYDVKTIANNFHEFANLSLSNLAFKLNLQRTQNAHQAGSDALLASDVFFKIKKQKYPFAIPSSLKNRVFGLNDSNQNRGTEHYTDGSSPTNFDFDSSQTQFVEADYSVYYSYIQHQYMLDFQQMVSNMNFNNQFVPYNQYQQNDIASYMTRTTMGYYGP